MASARSRPQEALRRRAPFGSKDGRAYGLEYASPKTAGSTALCHLKKSGITRRDKAEHSRRATDEMVDRWVKRYEAGESLKQTAGDEVNRVTVFEHLKKQGLKHRDRVEAQIGAVSKYPRRDPFCGDAADHLYIPGFVWGDRSVERHGRATRVRNETTHPDPTNLFKSIFGPHGHIRMYPKQAKATLAEWNLEVDFDSFESLREEYPAVSSEI